MISEITLKKLLALEIARKIRHNKIKLHPLRQLFWECTLRCNLYCRHCGSDCKKTAYQKDMPLADFLAVIDSISPHVNPSEVCIIITGGEPLMRADIEECGLALYHKGFPWGIVTNGLYLSRKRLDSLLASGMHSITISLDGLEKEHNWMRGHPESFTRATEAIKMVASEKDLNWDVVTCINRKNYKDLEELKNYLISIGVRNWRIFTVFPVGRAAEDPELLLTNQEFTGLMEFIKMSRKEGKIKINYACEGFLGKYEGEVRDNFYSCGAGVSVASILIDGSISACPSIRSNFYQGNIYRDNFMEIWNNRFENFRNREWMKKDKCAKCNYFRYCEGNGMHLRNNEGKLLICHYNKLRD
ncbi:radical SAM enzyme, rSAM/lipoprotein system [Bacteroides luti]|uniref:Radical SAM enzyme, rSAM/lipoprotein system n=1 Tax=Bacteroides luti TaxID=1297750 RepID=A0A1M5E9G2_9BACE|nr:TIGR04133 family radical SAM/SPASM protein [Bacteroides luti]SHF75691.1 radical SAM enzyme, rSAM/lipoprotein system [Bacteroides luti]